MSQSGSTWAPSPICVPLPSQSGDPHAKDERGRLDIHPDVVEHLPDVCAVHGEGTDNSDCVCACAKAVTLVRSCEFSVSTP